MIWTKTISVGMLAGVVVGDILIAGIVSLIFAIISASQQYNNARRKDDVFFDLIDFFVAIAGSMGAGAVGFFGGGHYDVEGVSLLVIVGLMSIAGFAGMKAAIDIILDGIKLKIGAPINSNSSNKNRRRHRDVPPDDWDN